MGLFNSGNVMTNKRLRHHLHGQTISSRELWVLLIRELSITMFVVSSFHNDVCRILFETVSRENLACASRHSEQTVSFVLLCIWVLHITFFHFHLDTYMYLHPHHRDIWALRLVRALVLNPLTISSPSRDPDEIWPTFVATVCSLRKYACTCGY